MQECTILLGANMADRFDNTVVQLAVVRELVSVEDVAVMEQRLQLQRRQWQELQHQVELREEQVATKLSKWTEFYQRCRQFVDATTKLEQRICDNQELSIEELLEKLDKVHIC